MLFEGRFRSAVIDADSACSPAIAPSGLIPCAHASFGLRRIPVAE
jgi:hypothetical protein